LPSLRSLHLLNFLSDDLSALIPLSVVILIFFSALLRESFHLLLLLHDFVQSIDFKLLIRGGPCRSFESFDLLDALIVILGLPFDILDLPVLGSLLAHLQLDFEGVERVHDRLVCVLLFAVVACFDRPLSLD